MYEGITLRYGFPDDAGAIGRLAALDSAEIPPGPLLLAEVGGELRAAVSLLDGSVIADPFQLTAGLIALLRERAAQLTGERARRAGILRRLHRRGRHLRGHATARS